MLQQRVAYAQWAHFRLSRLPIVQLARQDKRTWIATLPLHVQCVPSGTTLQSPSIYALLALQVWWMQTLTQRQSAPHAPLVVFLPPKLCLASIVLRVSTIMIAMLPPDAMHVWPEGLLLVLPKYARCASQAQQTTIATRQHHANHAILVSTAQFLQQHSARHAQLAQQQTH
jgi:hypothetical protein